MRGLVVSAPEQNTKPSFGSDREQCQQGAECGGEHWDANLCSLAFDSAQCHPWILKKSRFSWNCLMMPTLHITIWFYWSALLAVCGSVLMLIWISNNGTWLWLNITSWIGMLLFRGSPIMTVMSLIRLTKGALANSGVKLESALEFSVETGGPLTLQTNPSGARQIPMLRLRGSYFCGTFGGSSFY